jgi:hypothetical protein
MALRLSNVVLRRTHLEEMKAAILNTTPHSSSGKTCYTNSSLTLFLCMKESVYILLSGQRLKDSHQFWHFVFTFVDL